MRSFIYRYSIALSVLWAAVIFGLCATPGQYIPSVSWLELLSFDKLVHASVFFILSSLFFISLAKKRSSFYLVILFFLIAVSYGGGLEIMQAKVFSNRSGDWLDFIANTFGCSAALAFYGKIKRKFAT
jgi:VanZ family protein